METFAHCALSREPGWGSFTEKSMLGLIVMSLPLGIAVGLSAVAIAHVGPNGSASPAEEDAPPRQIKDMP